MIRLLIADDHAILRDGVRAMVELQPDIEVVGEAADGREAIERYDALRPDVVLMDLQMPEISGLEAIETIIAKWPRARIIVLTTYTGDAQALRALKAGAAGYLLKNSLRKELVGAIRSVNAGGKHLNPEIATEIALHAIEDPLSAREIQVLSLAAAGHSNKEIAVRMDVVEETIKAHMKAIFSKMGVRDRTHAVALAAKRGIIEI